MSLILDALKKADSERQDDVQATPSIDTTYLHAEYAPPNRASIYWIACAIAVIVIIAIITFIFVLKPSEESSKELTPASVQIQPSRNDKQAQKKTKPEISQPNDEAVTARKKIIAPQYSAQKTKLTNKIASTEPKKNIAALYKKNTQVKAHSEQTQESRKTTQVKKPPRVSAPKKSQLSVNDFHNIKLIKELSFSAQQGIPTLMYSGHQYSKNGSSSITLNGKILHEKNRASGGISIERILEDGVILKKDNYTFKMLALNSWLNYK